MNKSSLSIDSFVAYATRYSPDFLRQIEGASELEIARMEELSGYSLPSIYRQFLQRMGRRSADLAFEDCHINLRTVVGFYETMQLNPRLTLPDDCLVIGVYGVAAGDLCLDMTSGPDPIVVMVTDDDETEFYATSLLALLYHTAFYSYRLMVGSHQDYNSSYEDIGRRDIRPDAVLQATQMGFTGQWFDEAVNFHGERGDAALYFSQPPEHGLSLRVAADDPAVVQAICDEFARAFSLRALN